MQICSTCIYDEKISSINFDSNGVCNYCHQIEKIKQEFKTGTPAGKKKFLDIIDELKLQSRKKKYDVIIRVSGGTDSSYLLHLACELGLRPLAVHYDNTWNTSIATQNIKAMVSKLNIDLYTYVVDAQEQDQILLSFMKAGICGVDAATDLALAEVMYRAANKYGIKHVFEGHCFQAEGISPIGTSYTDGRFIKSVVQKYSNIKLKSYPRMHFLQFLRWVLFNRIKKIRPLWYLDYDKVSARNLLQEKYGWEYYHGHHLENRISAFDHSFFMPQKFKVDQRNNSLGAEVRSGKKTKEAALEEYNSLPHMEEGTVTYVRKRLGLSEDEFTEIMEGQITTFKDYKTYKKLFEFCRPLFAVLARYELVPVSFYLKYCFPLES